MPRRISLWIIAAIVLGSVFFASVAQAGGVNLEVNKRLLEPEVAPKVINGRTLVPVRIIVEELGASVYWNGKKKTVSVLAYGKRIELVIGQEKATVDGEEVPLDAPALLDHGRTLVPLRFIGEALGARVGWIPETKTVTVEHYVITGIDWQNSPNSFSLTVTVMGPVEYTTFLLPASGSTGPRLIVDFRPAIFRLSKAVWTIDQGMVKHVRFGMQSTRPSTARMVLDLEGPVEYRIRRGQGKNDLVLEIPHQVTGVFFEDREGQKAVHIKTTGPVEYETFSLRDPERIVVDLKNVVPGAGLPDSVEVASSTVKRIRAALFQAEPPVTRVVIDLAEPAHYHVTPTFNGLTVHFDAWITGVKVEKAEGKLRLIFTTTQRVVPEVKTAELPERLVLEIPEAGLALERDSVKVGLMGVEGLEGRTIRDESGTRTELTFLLSYYVGHDVRAAADGRALIVELTESPLVGKVVAVDAGHGGLDPGAIGANGTQEKDITIKVASRLKALLERSGAEVLMIREGDETVELLERPERANRAGADVYVSIHINSYVRDHRAGTETYHFPDRSVRLATTVHQRLVAALDRPDRGVKEARFAVLRHTVMPATLVELVFISNPEEERLLHQEEFLDRAAEGIWKGLMDYFRGSAASG